MSSHICLVPNSSKKFKKSSCFHVVVPEIKSPKKDVKPLGKRDNRMGKGDDGPKTAEDGAGKTVAGKKQKENLAGTSDEAAEKALSKYNSQSIVHLVAAQPRQQVAWATRRNNQGNTCKTICHRSQLLDKDRLEQVWMIN